MAGDEIVVGQVGVRALDAVDLAIPRGSIFGLLGAMVHYGRRRGSSAVGRQALGYAVLLGLFGFVMPGIDNWAHLGGLVLDNLNPLWLWYACGVVGLVAAWAFLILHRQIRPAAAVAPLPCPYTPVRIEPLPVIRALKVPILSRRQLL